MTNVVFITLRNFEANKLNHMNCDIDIKARLIKGSHLYRTIMNGFYT